MREEIESSKQKQLIEAAKKLFWKFGISRVSVEEICKEAGISKMTFYKYYPNKIKLAYTLLDGMFEDAFQTYEEIMNGEIPFTEKIIALSDLKRKNIRNLSLEMLKDIMQSPDSEIANMFEKNKKRSLEMSINFLKAAQQKGEIRQGIKMEFILSLVDAMAAMCIDENLLKHYKDEEALMNELLDFFFYGISPVNTH